MDILNQIIDKLNKEEIRNFKLLTQASGEGDRKDLLLFDYIRNAGPKFDEARALKKLGYSGKQKNRYYQLKNRLTENIGDSLVQLNTHKSGVYELFQFIQLSHIYKSRNLLRVALYYLLKAERRARDAESYEMLDTIYGDIIKLCSDLPEIKPDSYIYKRDSNAQVVADLRDLDNTLASLSHRLRISQNFAAVDKTALKKLQEKVEEVSRRTTSGYGKNLESKIYGALSQLLLQQHNYAALENLVKQTYVKFLERKWFDKTNHELKLQMLTYCTNALFKNQKFKESLDYAEKLGEEIKAFDKLHYEKYLFFYYNTLVNNYAEIDLKKGLQILATFEQLIRQKKNTYYDFYIYLNRAGLFYDLERYEEALKSLVRLYLSDGYTTADQAFKLKVEICELMITFEAGDRETLDYRLKQVKKDYAGLKEEKALERDFEVIDILAKLITIPDFRSDAAIQRKMKRFLQQKSALSTEDSEIIKYRKWISGKVVK